MCPFLYRVDWGKANSFVCTDTLFVAVGDFHNRGSGSTAKAGFCGCRGPRWNPGAPLRHYEGKQLA